MSTPAPGRKPTSPNRPWVEHVRKRWTVAAVHSAVRVERRRFTVGKTRAPIQLGPEEGVPRIFA